MDTSETHDCVCGTEMNGVDHNKGTAKNQNAASQGASLTDRPCEATAPDLIASASLAPRAPSGSVLSDEDIFLLRHLFS